MQLYALLNVALDGDGGQPHISATIPTGEIASDIRRMEAMLASDTNMTLQRGEKP